MQCANCKMIAEDLLEGLLTLIEFETPPEDRLLYAGGRFPVCCAPSRYFWLCASCSKRFAIRKWNSAGLVLQQIECVARLPPRLTFQDEWSSAMT
jgi:hypothetical protein